MEFMFDVDKLKHIGWLCTWKFHGLSIQFIARRISVRLALELAYTNYCIVLFLQDCNSMLWKSVT